MKIIRIKHNLTVVLNDGTQLTSSKCTDEMYELILANQDDAFVSNLLAPKLIELKTNYEAKLSLIENFSRSEYLTIVGDSVYIKSISDLSVPEDLALAIWKAEQADDLELLSTYLNFWTLTCLNPDSKARINLFWFLNKYGMTISKSGLFIAYRNAILKKEGDTISREWIKFITDSFTRVRYKLKKSPKNFYVGTDENGEQICSATESKVTNVKGVLSDLYESLSNEATGPIYTDEYTKKFTIRIGQPVTMARNLCDANDDITCSRGLHVAGKSWLKGNYFGDTGLRVLVNPSDVVAVPPLDSYGKMRVCAYYPVAVVEYNERRELVDDILKDGFEDNFMDIITYEGKINTDDENAYAITVPDIPELSRKRIMNRLADIKESLRIKNLKSNEN
jgi:hypothetical protein